MKKYRCNNEDIESIFGKPEQPTYTDEELLHQMYDSNILPNNIFPDSKLGTDTSIVMYKVSKMYKQKHKGNIDMRLTSKKGLSKATRVIKLVDAIIEFPILYGAIKGRSLERRFVWYLRRMDDFDRAVVKRHFERHKDTHEHYKILLADWDSLVLLADRKASDPPHSRLRRQRSKGDVWEVADTSAPILIGEDIWYIRCMYNVPLNQFFFDIRKWNKVVKETTQYHYKDLNVRIDFVPSREEGILITQSALLKLFEPLGKMVTKWKGEIDRTKGNK